MGNFNPVDDTMMESALVDAAQAPETEADSLSAALSEESTAEETVDTAASEESKALRGRMKSYENKGYNRGRREAEAAWAAEKQQYEARLAQYAQRDMEDEAKALAAEKHIPYDFALDHVRMKHNAPQQPTQPVQTRQSDPAMKDAQRRANTLMAQAEAFEKFSDGEVTRDQILEAFNSDPGIHEAVRSGQMDFTDVGKQLSGAARRTSPGVVRAANGNAVQRRSFADMSDSDFNRLNERIRHGAVFDSRK